MDEERRRLIESIERRPIPFKDGLGIFLFGIVVGMILMAMLV